MHVKPLSVSADPPRSVSAENPAPDHPMVLWLLTQILRGGHVRHESGTKVYARRSLGVVTGYGVTSPGGRTYELATAVEAALLGARLAESD